MSICSLDLESRSRARRFISVLETVPLSETIGDASAHSRTLPAGQQRAVIES